MATVKVMHLRDSKQAVLEQESPVVVVQAGPLHVREKRSGRYYLVEQGKDLKADQEKRYGPRGAMRLGIKLADQKQGSRRGKRAVSVAAVPGRKNTYVSMFQDKNRAVGKEKGKPVELIR